MESNSSYYGTILNDNASILQHLPQNYLHRQIQKSINGIKELSASDDTKRNKAGFTNNGSKQFQKA